MDAKTDDKGSGKCPVMHSSFTNRDWWPDQLSLQGLHGSDPMGEAFDYAKEFKSLDLNAVIKDLHALMTDSQAWWPADFGHYGGLFIRMAWHSAGTYRIADGRGGAGAGQQRFAPLNSWPDNANLDKARRLLWPIKQKYGRKISWADLMVLAGNVALDSMGFKTFGFGGGRADVWEPEELYWGPEGTWLGDERYSGERQLHGPLGAVQMGLIYVNPAGPNGKPDPVAAAKDIRETFFRMAMNDEETVALIAGGHSFGKTHGAGDPSLVGPEPEGSALEDQGLGWKSKHGTGFGADAITGGPEVTWTQTPTKWSNHFFDNLFNNEWELTKSPAGVPQWQAKGAAATIPDALRQVQEACTDHADHRPVVAAGSRLREDLAALLRAPRSVRGRVCAGVVQADASRHGPARALPRPARAEGRADLAGPDPRGESSADRGSGHCGSQGQDPRVRSVGVATGLDRLGVGVDVPRLRQARRRQRRAHSAKPPEGLGRQSAGSAEDGAAEARSDPEGVQAAGGKKVSLADVIVLGGCAAIEKAAKSAGHDVKVPFTPGRMDASQEQTDVDSFAPLEPVADGFRNYSRGKQWMAPEEVLIDRAQLLKLTAPEMTVLIGGLRVLGANAGQSKHGVFTKQTETLTNDFFVNLLDMGTQWQPAGSDGVYEGRDRKTNAVKWTGTRVDLIFGSHSQLRALAEVYACADAKEKFVKDFVAAWGKVMNLDRFDLA